VCVSVIFFNKRFQDARRLLVIVSGKREEVQQRES
jgi:hypothetical protein